MRLNLVDVDIETTVDCRFDFLEVRSTGRKGSASSVIGHYCGTHDDVNVSLPLGISFNSWEIVCIAK